jgi:hypothetical protein
VDCGARDNIPSQTHFITALYSLLCKLIYRGRQYQRNLYGGDDLDKKGIIKSLRRWLKKEYRDSYLVFETKPMPDYQLKPDLAMIQSRSDIIHVFDIVTKSSQERFYSIVWDVDSHYANYRWLVMPQSEYESLDLVYSTLRDYGIGLLLFTGKERLTFYVKLRPDYIDGNFIDYWPSLSRSWYG